MDSDTIEQMKNTILAAQKSGAKIIVQTNNPKGEMQDVTEEFLESLKGSDKSIFQTLADIVETQISEEEKKESEEFSPAQRREKIEELIKENHILLKDKERIDSELKTVIVAILESYKMAIKPIDRVVEKNSSRINREALKLREDVLSAYGRVIFRPAWADIPDSVDIQILKCPPKDKKEEEAD